MRALIISAACAVLVTVRPLAAQTPVVEVDTVEVTAASRVSGAAASTRSVQVITGDELRRLPSATVAEAVGRALGVDLMPRSGALADVGIRGSSFEQVLVMVDGVRVSDAQTGHFSLNLAVPLDQVDRIEVMRGGGSAVHGADALGGVINVVTRAAGAGASLRAETGSFGTRGVGASRSLTRDGARLDVAADLRRSDGHRPGTDLETGSVRAAASGTVGGHRIRADLGVAGRDFGANGFYGPYDSYEETRTSTATLGWEAPAASGGALGARVSARRNSDDFILLRDDPAVYRNQHTTLQLGGELTGRRRLGRGVAAAGVVEVYRDALESASLGDRTETRSAVGLELVAGAPGTIVATAGVRGDWHEAHGVVGSPSLAAAWWPARPLRLRAAASRSFRTPSWTDRYYSDPANVGDPDLAPERAWTAEAGGTLELDRGATLALTGFVRDADQLIDWVRAAGDDTAPWRIRNIANATFRGLELEATAAEILGARWTAGATLLSVSSTAGTGLDSKYALRPLTETVSLAVERELLPRLGVGGYARHARRRGDPAYLIVDGTASYALGDALVRLDVRNLLDETHVDITGMPAPGRMLTLGVSWEG